ncbi:LysR family transcriptional regulator [Serratia rhizosphaerae]|uniref:LysR family transcriptional regulator n=1 Tax=Serratia rhizosphaerae TaxID=2597702 RepID=A0ABX6GNJ1_9GAMM|nr:LysR family transcriptional regulator [Serratia rhizosphaerae]QHA87851.1 LysR family transcriptional regulator [Serratia rhizosphaerae]
MKGADYAELAVFMAVAKERSFRRAAQRLGLSPSAASHAIRALEQRLHVRLFNRTTRSVALTEAGSRLMAQLEPAMAALESAIQGAGEAQRTPRGMLRISMPRLAGHLVIVPAIERFMARYPDIRLEMLLDDNLQDIVAAGFDAGIRSCDRVPKDMIAVRLTADLQMVVVAAPGCFQTQPPPATPEEIVRHRCINYRWSGNGAQYRWRLSRAGERIEVDIDPTLTVNDIDLLLAAAEQGAGLALLEAQCVAPALRRGTLVRVLPQWCKPVAGFHLYYPRNGFMTPQMRAFVDFMRLDMAAETRQE